MPTITDNFATLNDRWKVTQTGTVSHAVGASGFSALTVNANGDSVIVSSNNTPVTLFAKALQSFDVSIDFGSFVANPSLDQVAFLGWRSSIMQGDFPRYGVDIMARDSEIPQYQRRTISEGTTLVSNISPNSDVPPSGMFAGHGLRVSRVGKTYKLFVIVGSVVTQIDTVEMPVASQCDGYVHFGFFAETPPAPPFAWVF